MNERHGRWDALLSWYKRKATYQPDQWLNSSAYGGTQWLPSRVPAIAGYGSGMMLYANVYRSQPAVRQVVQFIAENTAQVPLKSYERVSAVERRDLDDHPVSRMLRFPNPQLSQFEFMRDLVTDMEVFDVAFYQLARVSGELYVSRLFPDAVETRDIGPLGPETFRVHRGDGSYEDLGRGDVLYLKGYGTTLGISPIETLRRILSEDEAAGVFREGLYRNGMRNAGVIERPVEAPDWSDKARSRFLAELTDRYAGDQNSGKPLLLEEGMKWKSDQIQLDSSTYIEGRKFTTLAAANAYRIAPAIMGLTDAPYASITAYNQQLYQNVLAPRLTFYTQALERQLFTRDELLNKRFYLEFSLNAKLRGSFQEQAAIAQAAVGGPFMTVDEYRALVDLPPLSEEQRGELMPPVAEPGPVPTGAAETDQPAPSEQPLNEPKAFRWLKTPAQERGLQVRRRAYAGDLESVIGKTFDRILAQQEKGGTYSKARFGSELAKDLRPALERVVVAEASRKAAQLGGEFDPRKVQHYLDAKARGVGDGISKGAEVEVARLSSDPDLAKENLIAMAARVGFTVATSLVSFAREESAKQAGAGTKTWVVTSDNSRHPELDGETVKLGETFSNGLRYPGDPASGDAFDVAGCQCILDVS